MEINDYFTFLPFIQSQSVFTSSKEEKEKCHYLFVNSVFFSSCHTLKMYMETRTECIINNFFRNKR